MSNLDSVEKYIINNFNRIKINSNEINKGDVFISLQGKNSHGNKYINNCIKKGAIFCITDKKIKKNKNKKIIIVKNIYCFLEKLAIKKRKKFKGKVIGITGSAGKTTLKETIKFFLNKKFIVSASPKSYNNFLGVIISILNININSKFAIFEIGTNNFGEIKKLVKFILPSQVIVTNIQNTHLENFKNKKNIAIEKSSIFNPKFNPKIKSLILFNENNEEKLLIKKAKKFKIKKIIKIGDSKNNDYYINNIIKEKNNFILNLKINKKIKQININTNVPHRIRNLIFCISLFKLNKLTINTILNNIKKLKPVDGRGLIVNKQINKFNVKFIDETYNANPDTMKQSIEYFNNLNSKNYEKILILGNMNELGKNSEKFHINIIRHIGKYNFDLVILCGEFMETAVKKIKKLKYSPIIKKSEDEIIKYLKSNLHKNAIIMAKCSNSTIVNKFGKKFIYMKGKK